VQVLGQRVKALNVNGQQSGAAVAALLRPEAVAVVPDPGGAGEVTDRTFLGSAVRLVVTLDTGQKILAEASSHAAGVTLGDRVDVHILVDSVLVEETAPSPAP